MFYYLQFFSFFIGHYRKRSSNGLDQLLKEFWPEGTDKKPQLDYTQPFLVQELPDGSYQIINGNHRRTLFLGTPGGPTQWPCRVIPKEEVSFIYSFSCLFSLEINRK